ncbi:MAG: class I SAM-dependent methyltransferase [Magnetococcales bacterium]|nr:class I SAM-dependent methyltransferase [Magnetococcales bacterium]MBF0150412.1 class I SAM-dependent methyltransferase [Magnetococcales bacterium]MBF0346817.1 class I SAM-dependent methyltransferase [Magnetococcales bacterium]
MDNCFSEQHKSTKHNAYWEDLVHGTTGRYKEAWIRKLVGEHLELSGGALLDIGCGSCAFILDFRDQTRATSATFLDYDAHIIERMRQEHRGDGIYFQVADILASQIEGNFDLVFFLDMLHEVYSFHGRPEQNMERPVDHQLGLMAVRKAITRVSRVVNPGGGIVITDNVLCEENGVVEVEVRHEVVKQTLLRFFTEYPTRRMAHEWLDPHRLTLNARDFCILLTQYNKIKNRDEARWATERMEIHQYMTLSEYRSLFDALGYKLHYEIGTPSSAYEEWCNDFKVLRGLKQIPQKRITLLAVKPSERKG